MGFFDHLHKNGTSSIKSQSPTIRKQVLRAPAGKERLSTPAGPSPLSRPLSRSVTPRTNGTPSRGASPAISRTGSPRSSSSRSVARKRGSPAQQRLESSSSESESQEDFDPPPRKRTRHSIEPDLDRNVLCDTSFLEEPTELSFVHAADITSNNKGDSYSPAFTEHDPSLEILLRYPSSSIPERFQVVHPRDRDDFNPLEDMIQVIDSVCHYYLPKAESDTLRDDSSGFARRLKRALAHQSEQEYRDVVSEYNDLITTRRRDGTISRELRSLHRLDLELVERILTQTYSRIVSPRVGTLRHYENGTDNVYGELLPLFVSKIFADTKIKSQHLFVDLGSGVGNVVLQAALEIGCESWGCEMMDGPCRLADLQQEEFEARCKLWGLSIGKIHLERGDFLKNSAIAAILPKADVVLVNNQAFTPGLNDSLLRLFLDLKEGCQIVSLKSFVPHGHKITSRNFNSPVNLLQVEAKQYWSRSVSWTDAAGTYHIARKDSRMLRDFAKKEGLSRSSS